MNIDDLAYRVETLELRSRGVPYGSFYDQDNEERISQLEMRVAELQDEVSDLRSKEWQ